jgi:hypothetical protein
MWLLKLCLDYTQIQATSLQGMPHVPTEALPDGSLISKRVVAKRVHFYSGLVVFVLIFDLAQDVTR